MLLVLRLNSMSQVSNTNIIASVTALEMGPKSLV
jgi:hypothetical protein